MFNLKKFFTKSDDEILEEEPEVHSPTLDEARALYNNKKFKEAIACCDLIMRTNPPVPLMAGSSTFTEALLFKDLALQALEGIKVNPLNPRCPMCKSNSIADISYGIIHELDEEEEKLVKEGKLIFGGCIMGSMGHKHCNKCKFDW